MIFCMWVYFGVLHTKMKRNRYLSDLVFELSSFKIVKYTQDVNVKCIFGRIFFFFFFFFFLLLLLIFMIYFENSTIGFAKKLIFIRGIHELQVNNENAMRSSDFTCDVNFEPKTQTLFSIK